VYKGRLDEARSNLDEALQIGQQLDDGHILPRAAVALAQVLCRQGDNTTAEGHALEALRRGLIESDDIAVMYALVTVARVACLQGLMGRAAALLGAADAKYEAMGLRLPRNVYDPPSYDEVVTQVRASLGEAAFSRLSVDGHGWSSERVIDFALESQLDQPST